MKFMHSSMFTIDGNWGATIKYTAQTQHKTPNISENKTKAHDGHTSALNVLPPAPDAGLRETEGKNGSRRWDISWQGAEHAGEDAHWHTMLSVAASATVAVTVEVRGVSRHSTCRGLGLGLGWGGRGRGRGRVRAVVDKAMRMREQSATTTSHLLECGDCEVLAGDDESGEARRSKGVLAVRERAALGQRVSGRRRVQRRLQATCSWQGK